MARLLWICVAGAVGTAVRYLVGLAAARFVGTGLPLGTIAVNVVGCFLMSIVAAAGAKAIISPGTRLVLATGFIGGLTTYSAFNWETLALAREGAWGVAEFYAALTLVACMASGLLGLTLARAAFGH
ncbi:MAG: fluoride efflux transporter CrcB [Polyangiaceae bacterium]|jgi:CrcB protein